MSISHWNTLAFWLNSGITHREHISSSRTFYLAAQIWVSTFEKYPKSSRHPLKPYLSKNFKKIKKNKNRATMTSMCPLLPKWKFSVIFTSRRSKKPARVSSLASLLPSPYWLFTSISFSFFTFFFGSYIKSVVGVCSRAIHFFLSSALVFGHWFPCYHKFWLNCYSF